MAVYETRFTPVLRFVVDEGIKKSIEMTRLINEALGQTAPAAEEETAEGTAEEDVSES